MSEIMSDTDIARKLERWRALLSEGTTAKQHGHHVTARTKWEEAVDVLDQIRDEIADRRLYTVRKIVFERGG